MIVLSRCFDTTLIMEKPQVNSSILNLNQEGLYDFKSWVIVKLKKISAENMELL